jgi:hypothetical protein
MTLLTEKLVTRVSCSNYGPVLYSFLDLLSRQNLWGEMNVCMPILFIVGGSPMVAYQALAGEFSAIEQSPWVLILSASVRTWGFHPFIMDLDAAPMSREKLAIEIKAVDPVVVVFVVYGQNPNAGTTSMIGATRTARDLKEDIPSIKLSHKERPRRYRLDLSAKAVASRQALFGVILKIREACLHRSSPLNRYNFYCTSASLRLEGVEPNKSAIT